MDRTHSPWDDGWDPKGFRDAVEATCAGFVDRHGEWMSGLGEDAVRLLDAARLSVSGGKRLRAAFCWWGHHAVAPRKHEPDIQPQVERQLEQRLLQACSSLELLHASALVHDDYMDDSDVRRGRPATHKAFEALHRERGWSGDPERYGASAAILLGDLLLSWSDEMLRTCGLPAERVLAALEYLDLTRSEVVTGQFLDVSAQARAARDVDTAMTVVRYKSAKYSIERPLHVGASLGGASEEQLAGLGAFGLPLGEAFQLRDDLLGVFGDPATTGKPAGDDLREGKRTVLVALALDSLGTTEGQELEDALATDLTGAEVERLCGLIEGSGAREQVEQAISALTDTALQALDHADVDDRAREVLRALATEATQRSV